MKQKIALVALAISIIPASSFAAEAIFGAEGNDRCGVGTMIFGNKSSISSQLSEVSTDFTSMESISMTTGTSGCSHSGIVENIPVNEIIYASVNSEELMLEMASGRGESLIGLAQTMGCGSDELPMFMKIGKDKYSEIYGTGAKDQPVQMLKNFRMHLKSVPQLTQHCSSLQTT